jgi:predicted negative regulator of RcsB-dependent stress response
MDSHLPIIVIELVLVFGGVLLFGWWQLRSVKRDQQAAAAKKLADAAAERRDEPTPENDKPRE